MHSSLLRLSVVIPCFNEAATLRELVQRLETELSRLGYFYEVLVVNESNCDNSIVFACKGALSLRSNPSTLRKRVQFDQQTWDELRPAFCNVESALKKRFNVVPPEDRISC